MSKLAVCCFVSLLLSNISISAQDQIAKQTNIQVVIHRLSSDKNETYELFYNPRELKSPYSARISMYETDFKARVQEVLVCSNTEGDVAVVVARQSRNEYDLSISISDGSNYSINFPDLRTFTSFSSLKEGVQILSSVLYSSSRDTYQISVQATRYHTFQGGSVLQCSKEIFPLSFLGAG